MKWLIRLYPRWWRERYGVELEALLEDSQGGWWALVDVAATGLGLRLRACVPLLIGALLGTTLGMATTFWLTPWPLTSFWIRQSGRSFSQEEVQAAMARGITRVELATVIDKHKLFDAQRKWLPFEVVLQQFRRGISVDAERGGIRVRYVSPERNNIAAANLSSLVLKELVPTRPGPITLQIGFGDPETVRPYSIALPLLGALLGMAGALLGTRLRRMAL